MSKDMLTLVFLVFILIAPGSIHARCDASRGLSTPVVKFEALQASPIEALLRFGEKYDLCFGIEYVDKSILTRQSNFNLQNTTTKGAIEAILGSSSPLNIESHYGVIEISPRVTVRKKSLFDTVISKWVAQRGPVQLVSWLLHIQLAEDLNPQTTGGFGGSSAAGDPRDEVGPFNEVNQPVRYLLDKIVAQSKGATWIAQIPLGTTGISIIAEGRRGWTIVEYQGPTADYVGTLNAVAAQLP